MAIPLLARGTDATVPGRGSHWPWIVALGTLLLALSCVLAYRIGARDSASVSFLGALMFAAAAAQVVQAFEVRSKRGLKSCLVSGSLYGLAGILAVANPTLTAQTLVFLLALALIASGLMRMWWTLSSLPEPALGSLAASGAVTALVGVVFAIGWPRGDVIWILGTLLAMDLAWQGLMTFAFGLVLKELESPA